MNINDLEFLQKTSQKNSNNVSGGSGSDIFIFNPNNPKKPVTIITTNSVDHEFYYVNEEGGLTPTDPLFPWVYLSIGE